MTGLHTPSSSRLPGSLTAGRERAARCVQVSASGRLRCSGVAQHCQVLNVSAKELSKPIPRRLIVGLQSLVHRPARQQEQRARLDLTSHVCRSVVRPL